MIGTDELVSRIKELSDEEKLRLVDAILTDLNTRDSKIDRIWADEARKRWAAYESPRRATTYNFASRRLKKSMVTALTSSAPMLWGLSG